MYAGVPITLPACDRSESDSLRAVAMTVCSAGSLPASASATAPPRARTLANPQSITCTSPKPPTMMFEGLRSRWITPRACA